MERQKRFFKKRADITSAQLVTIILLVVGFGILIFLFWQFQWRGRIDKEACHQSVIFRATMPNIAGTKELVPLKCKTEKICITAGLLGGSCEDFGKETGITKFIVKDGTLEAKLNQIQKLIAGSIVDCWTTMGEGRVSLFSQYWAEQLGIGSVYPTCLICSRIAFDMTSLNKIGITENELAQMDVKQYMLNYAVPDKDISYYKYLVGNSPAGISVEQNMFKNIQEQDGNAVVQEGDEGKINVVDYTTNDQTEKSLQTKELAVMFMQITAPGQWDVAGNTIRLAIGGVAAGAVFSGPRFIVAAASKIANWWSLAITAIFAAYQTGNVARNRAITAGYCGDISMGTEARSGCSAVRTVNYNMEDIRKYCLAIESIP